MWWLLSCSSGEKESNLEVDSAEPIEQNQRLFFSTPYDTEGLPSELWRVAEVQGNDLVLFDELELGRSTRGELRFSGNYGIVALDNGTVSTIDVSDGGTQLLEVQKDLGVYASAVWPAGGGTVLIVDENWPENGGGLYRCELDVNLELTEPELLVSSKNGFDIRPYGPGWIYAAREVDGQSGQIHFLNRDGELERSVEMFGDDEAIFSALSLSGGSVYLADNAEFSSGPNRVARYHLESEEVDQIQVLDPVALIEGKFAGELLVVSGYGNAIYLWGQQLQEIAYEGDSPQLPTSAVRNLNSAGEGKIYITENQGIRAVSAAGKDAGLVLNGSGTDWISGALGITPLE